MHIEDLFDFAKFLDYQLDGYVRVQEHPHLPLYIANYTERAQFEKKWDDITLACRGLIFNNETGEIVARPFKKFFNYSEYPPNKLSLFKAVEITDKMDGSLGIMYAGVGGHPYIATRGSFASPQAKVGSALLTEKYPAVRIVHGYTMLFEIVYPQNRIVLNYGDTEDLFLLGAVEIETGRVLNQYEAAQVGRWPGPVTENVPPVSYSYETGGPPTRVTTLEDALRLANRENKEGVVVRYVDDDLMLKIKQDDYVALHKLVTGLTERRVWEALGEGKTVQEICEPLPDEFHDWVKGVAEDLEASYDAILDEIEEVLIHAQEELREAGYGVLDEVPRKEWAMLIKEHRYAGFIFGLLDGVDIRPKIWKTLRPVGAESPWGDKEE